jgi:hypothetical protein
MNENYAETWGNWHEKAVRSGIWREDTPFQHIRLQLEPSQSWDFLAPWLLSVPFFFS